MHLEDGMPPIIWKIGHLSDAISLTDINAKLNRLFQAEI